jgi:hypothetical protein
VYLQTTSCAGIHRSIAKCQANTAQLDAARQAE